MNIEEYSEKALALIEQHGNNGKTLNLFIVTAAVMLVDRARERCKTDEELAKDLERGFDLVTGLMMAIILKHLKDTK